MLKLNNQKFYVRNPDWAPILFKDCCDFTSIKKTLQIVGGASEDYAWFLTLMVTPQSGKELAIALANASSGRRNLAEKWIPELISSRVIHEGSEESAYFLLKNFLDFGKITQKKICRNVVLGISGSSAAMLGIDAAIELLSGFTDSIDVIVTSSATKFINTYPLEIHGIPVWRSLYQKRDGIPVPHIKLARDTDLVLVLPASARSIARTAHGTCDDLLSMVITCTRAPVVFFPSMNPRMLTSPPVARNIAQIIKDGRYVVYSAPTVATSDAHEESPPISQGAVGVSLKQSGNISAFLTQFLKKTVKI